MDAAAASSPGFAWEMAADDGRFRFLAATEQLHIPPPPQQQQQHQNGVEGGPAGAAVAAPPLFGGFEARWCAPSNSCYVEFTRCVASNTCSNSTIMLAALGFCLVAAVVLNAIAWYQFLAAWNAISRARTVDVAMSVLREDSSSSSSSTNSRTRSSRMVRRQIRRYLNSVRTVHPDKIRGQGGCPICLLEFRERECVMSCGGSRRGGGCGTYFHTSCLHDWLDRGSDSCPCCRRDMACRTGNSGGGGAAAAVDSGLGG